MGNTQTIVLLAGPLCPLIIIILVALDIKRRGCSNQISWAEAFLLYFLKVVHKLMVEKQFLETVHETSNYTQRQTDLLLSIVRAHEDTAHGRDHNFSNIRNVRDFRHSQTIVEYDQVQSYVDRVADGETSALLADFDPVVMFAATSGTEGGASKHYPVPFSAVAVTRKYWLYGSHHSALWRDVGDWNLRKSMFVTFRKPEKLTNSGKRRGVMTNILADTLGIIDNLSTPKAGLRIENEPEAHYVHALFGLRDSELDSIQVFFLPTLLTLVKRMHAFQDDLVNDIHRGKIKDDLDLPEDIRAELDSYLSPMPERAIEVKQALSEGLADLIPRLWPKLRYVIGNHAGVTGSAYYQEAVHCCGASVPVLSSVYACSEAGVVGLILDFQQPEHPVYTLMPDAAFYEFVPVLDHEVFDLEEIQPESVVRSDSLMIGYDYELFITTRNGLCRFRLGDVFKLVGFFNESPQLQFLYRAGMLLNILSEKVTEKVFVEALDDARAGWPAAVRLKDYMVASSLLLPHEEQKSTLPHHVLFVELEGPRLSEAHTNLVDESLIRCHEQYRECRETDRLGPMEVLQLQPNACSQYREYVASTSGQDPARLKISKALKSAERVQWFLDRKAHKEKAQAPAPVKRKISLKKPEVVEKLESKKFWLSSCCLEKGKDEET